MKKRCILIRHAKTKGNDEKRYIGANTDEELSKSGIEQAERRKDDILKLVTKNTQVFSSPMKRALQTAKLLFGDMSITVIKDLKETDFGLFEGKNYAELNGQRQYQEWIDSGGELPFPGGESRAQFAARCVSAFQALELWKRREDCAIVAHGGTVMAIMEACACPRGRYFDFQLRCGEGYALSEDGSYQKLNA